MEKQDNLSKNEEPEFRDFSPTRIALKNKITIFIFTVLVFIVGYMTYQNIPKELFPEVNFPYVMVQTIYPGNAPSDIENLITRPIEKEIDGIKGIKTISSTSMQDASMIMIEFTFETDLQDALNDVKDAVDKAKSDLPTDLLKDPIVKDIDLSEFPFINVNIYGDFSLDELKKYADNLDDLFSGISEVSKVEIQGIADKEVQVNVDVHKMDAMEISLRDIEGAIKQENVSVSGGDIKVAGATRTIHIDGEFKSVDELKTIIVKHKKGNIVYLGDIADVKFTYADPNSITRLNGKPVLSLQLVKKSGKNLLAASEQVYKLIEKARKEHLVPPTLHITTTNDQSDPIKKQLDNLENSIIMSVFFVVLILFLFLGFRNAVFVGLAIPLSMYMSYTILGMMGEKINMVVLFGLILALGMLVDNSIVVVENIYRWVSRGFSKSKASYYATGEVAVPIIASTLTTLAAFFPLLFWNSTMGRFMHYLPVVLIIVLSSSLFVALVLVPVFSNVFVKTKEEEKSVNKKKILWVVLGGFVLAVPLYLMSAVTIANVLIIMGLLVLVGIVVLDRLGKWFATTFLNKLDDIYTRLIRFSLRGKNPYWFFIGTFLLLFLTIAMMKMRQPKVIFFADSSPNYINVRAELPIGTSIEKTDAFMRKMETDINAILKPYRFMVKSVLVNVGKGVKSSDRFGGTSGNAYQGMFTISFIDYKDRKGINTSDIMAEIGKKLINHYPGVKVTLEKDQKGPPTGKAVNIEISGEDFTTLLQYSDSVMQYIEKHNVKGIENLQVDLEIGKPELDVHIDRNRARRFGLSTAQIATTIRTALYGNKVSDYKEGEDKYPIQLRFKRIYRNDVSTLMNQKIMFRNQGKVNMIPLSAVADFTYNTTYGSIKRKQLKRTVTVFSNVLEGYNSNDVNKQIKEALASLKMPANYKYDFTGEQEKQRDAMAFLSKALMIALFLIMLILVTQFNSLIKPVIIMFSVLFSTIGVLGGIAIFNFDFVVIMTGIGIVSLAGIVVNNAIVLIDYIELLKQKRRNELHLAETDFLPVEDANECVVEGGRTRLRPVLLTAITTIFGLLPMAVKMNINFTTLFTEFNPHIYFGGDMADIWAPLARTVILGLTFSTFLTLVIVPVMYRIVVNVQKIIFDRKQRTQEISISEN